MITKPMLAGTLKNLSDLKFPVLATPKLDGIRCLKVKGRALTRKFLQVPNNHIRTTIELGAPDGCDGEIVIPGRNFNDLSGDVRRVDGKPNFVYSVFDFVSFPAQINQPYQIRMQALRSLTLPDFCVKILPIELLNSQELYAFEAKCLSEGFEGVMVRSPNSPYKCGRSSVNEGYLLKIKRFADCEGTVIGFEEEYENQNTATQDAFGRTKRASNQENLRPKGTLGKLVVRATPWKEDFGIGTGYTAAQRAEFWATRSSLLGKTVKFKHQPSGGADRPRFPVFLGFREAFDMS